MFNEKTLAMDDIFGLGKFNEGKLPITMTRQVGNRPRKKKRVLAAKLSAKTRMG